MLEQLVGWTETAAAAPLAGDSASTATVPLETMDEAAFQALYQRTAPALGAYVRRTCGQPDLAEDILQETFLKFLKAPRPAMDEASTRAYLYRTATTLIADHWRKRKREEAWSLKAIFRTKTAQPDTLSGDMARMFERLAHRERALLWLAYVEGFDHREIAAVLGLRVKSIKVLLFRARKKLAAILTSEGLAPEMGS